MIISVPQIHRCMLRTSQELEYLTGRSSIVRDGRTTDAIKFKPQKESDLHVLGDC